MKIENCKTKNLGREPGSQQSVSRIPAALSILNSGSWIPNSVFLSFLLFTLYFLPASLLFAFDRSNIPLKNWGGFSAQRSWMYDALERIVLAGLADQAILNTKPISRVEAARIVAQAVRRLDSGEYGDYHDRTTVEELLYRLIEELGPELSELGVKTPLNREASPSFFGFEPVEHVQFGTDFSSRDRSVVNSLGREAEKGGTISSTLDGRMHAGDFFSLYYQPEVLWSRDHSLQGRLLTGYAKLTFWNTELLAGKESLWWGPGFRGSMTFSNNARPLDQVRLSSAEPFHLPWLFKYLGPTKLALFLGQLEERRDFPHAKVAGWRINIAPWSRMEIGFSRVFQFGGRGRPTMKPWEFLRLLVDQGSDDTSTALNVNNLMSLDVTVRLANVEPYIFIARDLSIYGELGWDDTIDPGFTFLFLPTGALIPRKPGGLVGLLFSGLFGGGNTDLRFEFAKTSDIQFNHDTLFFSGFSNRGFPLSHFIGTEGSDIFLRVTRWLSPDFLLGVQTARTKIGSTEFPLKSAPKEERNSFGLDVSYRMSDQSSLFLSYNFARVKNRGFVAGKTANENFFRFEFTRSF